LLEQTEALSEAHHMSRMYYKLFGGCLTIASLVLGTFASSTALFTGGNSISDEEAVAGQWNIAMGCMGIASTVFVAINTLVSPGALEAAHHDCEKSYNKVRRDITSRLLTAAEGNEASAPISTSIAHFREELDAIGDHSPPIPYRVRKIVVKDVERRRSVRESIRSGDSESSHGSDAVQDPGPCLNVAMSGRIRVSFDLVSDRNLSPVPRREPDGTAPAEPGTLSPSPDAAGALRAPDWRIPTVAE
jgi:hypothetical protein